MKGDEVGPVPVVGKSKCHEAIVREDCRYLLKVEVLFLPRVEISIGNSSKFHDVTSQGFDATIASIATSFITFRTEAMPFSAISKKFQLTRPSSLRGSSR